MPDRPRSEVSSAADERARGATNPYVGPRPFEEADRDRFFGREREIRQLASLVVARRVVVLYARSGAGKTSLLEAGLIPYLEKHKRIGTLPMLRVGGNLEGDREPLSVTNVYTRGALRYLLGDRVSPAELATLSLAEGLDRYLASSADDTVAPRLLIVDQLEELFRIAPTGHQRRVDFFVQLQCCLDRHPRLSLLLSLREDAVAELDPHAALLLDRLRSRFRLELLREDAALEAIQGPARQAGVEIADAVARRLVDELRTVRIQRSDGSREEVLGPHVEPVHLQVVCHRLWSESVGARGGDGGRRISLSDLPAVASIDRSLAAYYDEQMAAVAVATGARERVIRAWLELRLITKLGIRGQVLRCVGHTEGLPNEVVEALVDARLVRAEMRRGVTWLELAHDCLVEPVKASNAAWRQEHLRPMQARADLWMRGGRPQRLLLSSGELRRELAWVETRGDELTPAEEDYLAASRRARRTRRLRGLVLLVSMLLVGAVWRVVQEQEYRQRELVRGLAAQARSGIDERLDLALLLSLEANRIDSSSAEARGSLLSALQYQPRRLSSLHGHEAVVWSIAFSPRGEPAGGARLASGDLKGRILLWDVERRQLAGAPLRGHMDRVLSLVFSADGRYLVSTGRDRKVLLWDLSEDTPTERALADDLVVTSVAFDPRDGQRLITGDTDGEVSIWDLSEHPPQRRKLGEHQGWVTSLAADPSGSGWVASGGTDNQVWLWRLDHASAGAPERLLEGHGGWLSGLAWAQPSKILVSASLDGTVRRWNIGAPEERLPPLRGPFDRLSGAATSPDGEVLAAATANGLIYLWNVTSGRSLGPPLASDLALMHGLAFSPDGRILATGSGTSVLLWDVADPEGVVSALGSPLAGGSGMVTHVAFHPGGELVAVAVGGDDPEIRILDSLGGAVGSQLATSHPGVADAIAWSADGKILAEFGDDGKLKRIRLWDWRRGTSRVAFEEEISSGISEDPERRALQSNLGDFARILEQTLEPRLSEGCPPVRAVAYADGRLLVAEGAPEGKTGSWVDHWNVQVGSAAGSEQHLGGVVEGAECVRSLSFSPDGETVAAGSDRGTVTLFTLAGFEPRGDPLEGHVLPERSLAFSPDGRFLASAGDESTIHIRDLAKGAGLPKELVGHSGVVQALAFNPQSSILASAGTDHTVILWDVATGLAIGRPLTGHRGPIRSLVFSSDGQRLVSGGDDGAWLWQLGFEVWRERACRVANRELRTEERELYLGSKDGGGACSE